MKKKLLPPMLSVPVFKSPKSRIKFSRLFSISIIFQWPVYKPFADLCQLYGFVLRSKIGEPMRFSIRFTFALKKAAK